jgi:hypothetical protein
MLLNDTLQIGICFYNLLSFALFLFKFERVKVQIRITWVKEHLMNGKGCLAKMGKKIDQSLPHTREKRAELTASRGG